MPESKAQGLITRVRSFPLRPNKYSHNTFVTDDDKRTDGANRPMTTRKVVPKLDHNVGIVG